MSKFNELKDICAKRIQEVGNLWILLNTRIITRDLEMLIKKMPERSKKADNKYIIDDKIFMYYITDEGNLHIIDDRATAFSWLFELEYEEQLRIEDTFTHNNQVYSVKYLNENVFDGCCEEIQKIIEELDATIAKF